MIKEIYNELLNDYSIRKIYDQIGVLEDEERGWAYHNYEHILNVTDLVEKILSSLGYDEEFITKAKIACLFHDVGALQGKDNHALRSYEYTKKYFKEHNISFDGDLDVLEAIKIHSEGFDSNNIIALSLILADKLDIKKTRITKAGKKVIGNRQYKYIEDIIINITDNCLMIKFVADDEIDIKELNEYYFTKKILKAIDSFSKKMNLTYRILLNDNVWSIN